MANITLTNLPTVTGLNGTEPLLGVQSSTSVQITTGQIVALAKGVSTLPFSVSVGGTGDTTLTQYGLMYGNGTNPVGTVAQPAGNNYVLVASPGSAPSWQPTIPVTAGVDSVAFGTTGLTPVAATAGVVSVAFGTVPTAAGIYSPATNQIALSTASTQRLLIDATGAATFSTSVTSPLLIATASRTATATTGAFSYGTNSFSDTGVLSSLQASVNSYLQHTIQNTSNGSLSSAEFIAYNDQGTASTNYATVGINSSGYTGAGSINAPGYGYFLTATTDLVLGTIGANAIHFAVNSGATDVFTLPSSGTRFQADFSNATITNRLSFQTYTTNASTGIYVLPNGTSTAASIQAANAADPTNASKILIATNGSTDVQLVSGINGTGTYLPLSFYTNGAQKMQLGTAGTLALGTNAVASVGIQNSWAITGATTAWGQLNSGAVQSGVTTQSGGFESQVSAAAASFTLGQLYHFYANPNAGGAGSTVTSQAGFFAETTVGTQGGATLTNAYGFYGNLASGSNRWNLYMGGSANNYMAGALGVGTTTVGVAGSINAIGAITFQTTTNNQSYTTTGAGTITISSGTAGSINNMTIGNSTAAAGTFTALTATGAVTLNTTTNNQSYTTTGAGTITISSGTAGSINNMSIGATTPSTGAFTTLSASSTVSGTGFSTYLASPPAIGGTAAAAGSFTTLTGSTSILSTGAGGVGYATGAGGAVTQLTSRTTGVTLNKTSGAITMFTAAGSASAATFTVTNSTVAATDTISLSMKTSTNLYILLVTAVAAGSFNITFYTTGGTTSDTPVINFNVIKGVAA